ncbi:DMSO/TMAO reductase YedYZ molybdopterin-dependent catalytic subunit [Roseiarcus fermentans]|uniref:DMSO/TMAO reductase YedYZ molybdopterin-dependent catalytic subunit n=1 Tax=Roseiarcus fermentans TaxID=1473586 RepID=A0A366FLU8_9HYPH|nr:molybdopterin-binding protein [Roseiarcus fermentans]RBP15551.1 DMSO/TMAO reductase YedYZ molybdopterin-dependent catalytic subunit [Roseiarcus fermentans]
MSRIQPADSRRIGRRQFLGLGAASLGAALLGGCDRLSEAPSFQDLLGSAEGLTYRMQRLLGGGRTLAREFSAADLSPDFKVNGTHAPDTPAYAALRETGFADWRLRVDGLVVRPLDLSLADLVAMPQRTQITRHDCVEGWSAIGKWQGVPLADVLTRATLLPAARFAVFHCADMYEHAADGTGQYYESIDLIDAFHPQTILAHRFNDEALSVGHGAPLRLRVERQLGYKQAKYVMRIEMTDRLDRFGRGKGGFWPDRGYEWYAGI